MTLSGIRLLAEALPLAPPAIKTLMDAKFEELGLIPKTQYVGEEGNPVFTVEQIAEAHGVSEDDVIRMAKHLNEEHPIKGGREKTVHPLN